MQPMDRRKIRILHTIVEDYVQTYRPVGSERLIEICDLGCKPATIRNEMAEMAEMGYLAQPHTSAGRIPTDQGYRFYVDALMEPDGALSSAEKRSARVNRSEVVEELLQQTCRMLSELTSYASLATDPATDDTVLRRIYLTEGDSRHLLLVALLSTGHVEHRLLETEIAPEEAELLRLSNFLNERLAGGRLAEIGKGLSALQAPAEMASSAALLRKIAPALSSMAALCANRRLYMEGAGRLLKQPEFQDVQRLEMLLNALDQRGALLNALSRTAGPENFAITIGAENEWQPIQECSVISTVYHIGQRAAGYLGVVGPTRMNYGRTAAAVRFMAGSLSHVLTNLSLA